MNPNYSSYSSSFDAARLIERTAAKYRAYTLKSSLFLVNFKIGILVKKKTLQEPLSIQVDLNRGIKEGLILLWLTKQLMKKESKIHNTSFLISPTMHLFPLAGQSRSHGISIKITLKPLDMEMIINQSIQSCMSILNYNRKKGKKQKSETDADPP